MRERWTLWIRLRFCQKIFSLFCSVEQSRSIKRDFAAVIKLLERCSLIHRVYRRADDSWRKSRQFPRLRTRRQWEEASSSSESEEGMLTWHFDCGQFRVRFKDRELTMSCSPLLPGTREWRKAAYLCNTASILVAREMTRLIYLSAEEELRRCCMPFHHLRTRIANDYALAIGSSLAWTTLRAFDRARSLFAETPTSRWVVINVRNLFRYQDEQHEKIFNLTLQWIKGTWCIYYKNMTREHLCVQEFLNNKL